MLKREATVENYLRKDVDWKLENIRLVTRQQSVEFTNLLLLLC